MLQTLQYRDISAVLIILTAIWTAMIAALGLASASPLPPIGPDQAPITVVCEAADTPAFPHRPTSGAHVDVNEPQDTYLVGSYGPDLKNILEELDYPYTPVDAEFPPAKDPFNLLNVSDEDYEDWAREGFFGTVNSGWVDSAVAKRSQIIIVSDPRFAFNEQGKLTGFGKELHRLEWMHNYRINRETLRMEPANRSLHPPITPEDAYDQPNLRPGIDPPTPDGGADEPTELVGDSEPRCREEDRGRDGIARTVFGGHAYLGTRLSRPANQDIALCGFRSVVRVSAYFYTRDIASITLELVDYELEGESRVGQASASVDAPAQEIIVFVENRPNQFQEYDITRQGGIAYRIGVTRTDGTQYDIHEAQAFEYDHNVLTVTWDDAGPMTCPY